MGSFLNFKKINLNRCTVSTYRLASVKGRKKICLVKDIKNSIIFQNDAAKYVYYICSLSCTALLEVSTVE